MYALIGEFLSENFTFSVEPGPLVQLGCGTISGALGATCVYPLQVIRTRYEVTNEISFHLSMVKILCYRCLEFFVHLIWSYCRFTALLLMHNTVCSFQNASPTFKICCFI